MSRHAPRREPSAGPASSGWLEQLRAQPGEREAIVRESGSLCYAELADAVSETLVDLSGLDWRPGDLIAVLAPPSIAGVVLIHALLEARVALLPLNLRLSELEQREALRATRPVCLVVSPEVDPALASRLAADAGCALVTLRGDEDPSCCAARLVLERPAAAGACALGSTGQAGASEPEARRRALADAGAALVLQTSGTSGRPKGVVLGLDNLLASARASTRLLGGGPGDRWLLCMPLFHIGGLSILLRGVLDGSSVLIHERFDARRVARDLETCGVTRVSFVATMLARLIEARGARPAPASLSLVLLGGGPAPQSLLERARALGYPVAPTYGLTEAASQVATRPPDRAPASTADLAAGLEPLPGVELRIVDDRGAACEAGVEGEIQLRGPTVMRGYLDDPVATAAVLVGGWLSTGDFGRLDSQGRLRVLDRRSDLIVSGGENVYPAEVESVLASHPSVAEAGVIGWLDLDYGARPLACVVVAPGSVFDAAALAAFCRERLAAYKVPTRFRQVEALPRTASGKLKRSELARSQGRASA